MAKKILVLSGSPRLGGNSDLLCDAFMKGAKEAGHQVEKIRIATQQIGYCRACYYCKKHAGECAIKDDMATILERMLGADVIVMASPVYFYSIDAQLKTLIDRTVARWTEIRDKEFYYIATAAEAEREALSCTIECMRGLAACLKGSVERGVILGGGFYERGTIAGSPVEEEAYQMGLSV